MEFSDYEQLKEKLLQEQKTWLITGVAGFIGSHLLEELLRLDQKVVGIDNFCTGSKKNIEDVLYPLSLKQQKNFFFHEGDIRSSADCNKVVLDVDIVLHHAALGSIPRSIKMPDAINDTNVCGFLNMLTAAKDAGVYRFIYASSSSVYGDSTDLPKQEDKIGNPLSPYAVSKRTNELYAQTFSHCYGIETIGLRYFNVFGPRQHSDGPYAAVIPRWISALKRGDLVYIYGDGETTRDFCYVVNAVQASLLAATTENRKAINTVYNVAVGENNSLKKLYETIVNIMDITSIHNVVYQDFRPSDIRHSLADIGKAKNLLGYFPTLKLRQGLETMMHVGLNGIKRNRLPVELIFIPELLRA